MPLKVLSESSLENRLKQLKSLTLYCDLKAGWFLLGLTGFLRSVVGLANDFRIEGHDASFIKVEKDFVEYLFLKVFAHPF